MEERLDEGRVAGIPSPFAVSAQSTNGCAVIEVVGEVDLATAPALRKRLARALEHRQHVVVDLSRCSFCDSTGLSALLSAWKRAREQDGVLALTGVHGTVGRVLRVTGVDRVLPLFDHPRAAAEAIATPEGESSLQ